MKAMLQMTNNEDDDNENNIDFSADPQFKIMTCFTGTFMSLPDK